MEKQLLNRFRIKEAKGAGIRRESPMGIEDLNNIQGRAPFQTIFRRKAWILEGMRGNKIVLCGRDETGGGEEII